MAFDDMDQDRIPCYSIRSELDGSYDLGVALGEGWEPFAVVPTTALNEWREEYQTALIYLRIKN